MKRCQNTANEDEIGPTKADQAGKIVITAAKAE